VDPEAHGFFIFKSRGIEFSTVFYCQNELYIFMHAKGDGK